MGRKRMARSDVWWVPSRTTRASTMCQRCPSVLFASQRQPVHALTRRAESALHSISWHCVPHSGRALCFFVGLLSRELQSATSERRRACQAVQLGLMCVPREGSSKWLEDAGPPAASRLRSDPKPSSWVLLDGQQQENIAFA